MASNAHPTASKDRPFRAFLNDELRTLAKHGLAPVRKLVLQELCFRKSVAAARLWRELTGEEDRPQSQRNPYPIKSATEGQLRSWWRQAVLEKSDKTAASQRIALVEDEWRRRHQLPTSEPRVWGFTSPDLKAMGHEAVSKLRIEDWPSTGMLSRLGYHVGVTSKLEPQDRRALLSAIMASYLPPLNSPAYVALWGVPHSVQRLQRMRSTILGLAAHAQNRPNTEHAVTDWMSDADFLDRTFGVAAGERP